MSALITVQPQLTGCDACGTAAIRNVSQLGLTCSDRCLVKLKYINLDIRAFASDWVPLIWRRPAAIVSVGHNCNGLVLKVVLRRGLGKPDDVIYELSPLLSHRDLSRGQAWEQFRGHLSATVIGNQKLFIKRMQQHASVRPTGGSPSQSEIEFHKKSLESDLQDRPDFRSILRRNGHQQTELMDFRDGFDRFREFAFRARPLLKTEYRSLLPRRISLPASAVCVLNQAGIAHQYWHMPRYEIERQAKSILKSRHPDCGGIFDMGYATFCRDKLRAYFDDLQLTSRQRLPETGSTVRSPSGVSTWWSVSQELEQPLEWYRAK